VPIVTDKVSFCGVSSFRTLQDREYKVKGKCTASEVGMTDVSPTPEKPANRTCAGQLQAINPLVRDTDYTSAGGSLKKLVCFLMLFISPAASGVDILAAPLLKESQGGRCRPPRCTKTVDTVFMAVLSSGCTVFASSDNAPVIPGAQGSYL
jgi:hypothetical protein